MSSAISMSFLLAFFAFGAVSGVIVFSRFDRTPFVDWRFVGHPTVPDRFWCRRHCFFRTPFHWQQYCIRYCYRTGFSFLAEQSCGKMALWEFKDSCESFTQRFRITIELFKTLNPFYDHDCNAAERPEHAGLMFCVKELGPGEESHPLPCQQFHTVRSTEKTLEDVSRSYKERRGSDLDLVKLNPTVKPDGLIAGEILCIARDSSRPLPPPCDVFYPFSEGEDCSSVLKLFDSHHSFSIGLEEFNRLNPEHPCAASAQPLEKVVPGQMVCLRQPKDNTVMSGSFLEEDQSTSAATESTTSPITTTPAAETTTGKA